MSGTKADEFIEIITPLIQLGQAVRVVGMALNSNGQWFNLGIRVQLLENLPTISDIQSPDQRFLYYVIDLPLDSLPHVVGQLTGGSAFKLEKDQGVGGAFAEISLKPLRADTGLGTNWYSPTKREPTMEQRKSSFPRSLFSFVSSRQSL